jgi:hypothetical protein
VDASEGHVADAVPTVEDTVRIESYPARRSPVSSYIVAGELAGVAPPPGAELAASPPGLLVQPSGIVTWFWLDPKQELAGEMGLK